MKSTFLAAVFLFFALFFCFRLEAAETIIIDGRAESNSNSDARSSRSAQGPGCPDQSQILVKLNELELDHKQILQQLADMKQELYTIKVRASRC